MTKSEINKVPAGTETEEWRLMSAEISWQFWRNELRSAQISEQLRISDTWDTAATDFRSFIRAALRHGEIENIKFKRIQINKIELNSEEWRQKTARFSWLLWLKNNRMSKRIPEWREIETWNTESASYRKYVRSVISSLEQSGIYLHSS